MNQVLQSFLLLLVCIGLMLVSRGVNNHTSSSTITQLVRTCDFAPGGKFVNPPYPKSNDWCLDSPREPLFALMAHMKLNSVHSDACFGAEFGSLLRIIYFPLSNIFMLNPVILKQDIISVGVPPTMWPCKDSFGTEVSTMVLRTKFVSVSFIRANLAEKSINLTRTTMQFAGKESCIIQAIYERL